MIDSNNHKVSMRRQSELLDIKRSMLYYKESEDIGSFIISNRIVLRLTLFGIKHAVLSHDIYDFLESKSLIFLRQLNPSYRDTNNLRH